jgi:DNA polymerase-3 subunit alpha
MKIIRSEKPRMRIIPSQPKWWSVHTHSRFSNNDALPTVDAIVEKAAAQGQRAVGLTDHGNMAGSVQLYNACRKKGLKPFPGTEFYFVPDIAQHQLDYADSHVKASRFHLGIVAYNGAGYENLVRLNTVSHQQHFHKPLIDFATLGQAAEDGRTEGLAVTTGCYFGYTAQTLINYGDEACERWLATLNAWFPSSVYVELQNHNITHDDGSTDDELADGLMAIADRMGLPCVVTQDSHYLEPDDRDDHESLKRLIAFGPDDDDAVFPGDGFQLGDDRWLRDHHSPARYERGIEGLDHLLDRHGLRIPVLDSYSYSVPRVVRDSSAALLSRVWDEFNARGLPRSYRGAVKAECDLLIETGFDSYMLLVAMVTDFMRENDIVFQTRGSAAGSLVCWLLGISNVDPIKWDLRFERFLSRDRTKPPDIDLDIAHDRRQEVIDWLSTKFATHQIGTWAMYGMTEGEDEDDDDKGSLLRRYFSRNKHREEKIETYAEIPDDDKKMLWRLSDRKLYSGMGKNAAGVVVTSTQEEFHRLVPLAHGSSAMVTQYSKDDVEALGLVKLDVLGSKTLTVLEQCCRSMGKPISYLEEIPLNDKQTYQFASRGSTEGIFQLEGWTSKKGIKRLRPSSIKDVIAAMALFRTAVMKSGGTDAYINRKHGKETIPERHSTLMHATKETYGVLLYQEQVIDILRGLGMEAEDLTKFLKAVKASNKDIGAAGEVIKSYRGWLEEKMEKAGFNEDDRRFVDEAIAGFAEYGFNRAHATVYGITAYRCAWLVVHAPLHFHAALLAVAAGSKKELGYVKATRDRGIRLARADINASGATYRADVKRGAIRKGLISIKGIGVVASNAIEKNQPYKTLQDLLDKTPAKAVTGRKGFNGDPEDLSGNLAALRDAGALDSVL